MGAALSLALGLNAQTGRKAVINQNPAQSGLKSSTIQNRGCGTQTPSEEWDRWFNAKVEEFKTNSQQGKAAMVAYNIPVVVHVIHNGTAVGSGLNISAAQIQDQINILNADYAGTGLNSGNVPAVFASSKANTNITFCLAQLTPSGSVMTEPGIDRINRNTKGWTAPPYNQTYIDNTIKPNSIWDPTRYLNMWVTDLGGGLLGYATFPIGTGLSGITGNGSSTTDGVVMLSSAFGSIGSATSPPYNKGRTTTHEVGHWLGLRHSWGDANCGNDFCNDTPPAQTSNFGCPTHPFNVGVCSGNTTGEMFQNFMDYTDDACMYMFTNDQSARIQTAMANGTYRSLLSTSATTLCNIAPSAPVASISIPSSGCTGSAVAANNLSTGNPIPTYSWSSSPSAGVVFNPNTTATNPSITFSTPGAYTITVVATNSLGTNSNSKSITITTCITPTTCADTISNWTNTDTMAVYTAAADAQTPGCSPKAGYVAGNNCYGDKEKAEFFAFSKYSTMTVPQIKGVIVLFYKNGTKGTAGNSASSVGMKIYNGTSATAAPGSLISQTATTLGTILGVTTVSNISYCGNPSLNYGGIIKPYRFNFATPVNAPTSGGFYASLVLPTGSGDTAVVFNNLSGVSNTAWEQWSDNSWHDMKTAWGGATDYNLAILPDMACAGTVGVKSNSVLDNNITLYPNPSNGLVSVIATLPGAQTLELSVYNALGQLISSSKHSGVTSNVINLDLSNNSNGVYFVTINNGQEKIVKRLILNK